ncbi:MAG: SulP family inorganic anion transporter [Peptococcus niger]
MKKIYALTLGLEYMKDLKWEFKGYDGAAFSQDLMAGTTVAAVALPLALAFGVGSGASAAAGLVTAVLGGLVISSFSGASYQISGPTGAMMAILLSLVAKEGLTGVLVAGFLAGILLVLAGLFRLGRIISFVPSSVITGFTSGIAAVIALGQLDHFFGIKSEGDLALLKVASYFQTGAVPDVKTTAIGLGVILLMIAWPKKWNVVFPSSLMALAVVLAFQAVFHWDVPVVGEIPRTLFLADRLTLGDLNPVTWPNYIMPAISIALLSMVESLLCGASAEKMTAERLRSNRELVAQGLGNLVIPFFGGIPATAAIARTSVAIKSGCRTRLTGIIHSIILLLSMFILTPVMSAIPLSALAGVLMVTAWRMNDWSNIRFIFSHRFKSGIAKFSITLAATVLLDLTQAIIIGVVFSLVLIVARMSQLEINIADVDNARLKEIGMGLDRVPDINEVRVVYITGTLFLGVVDRLKDKLLTMPHSDVIILSMRGVPVIDLSGVQALMELAEELEGEGTQLSVSSVQPAVKRYLERSGFLDIIGRDHLYPSAEQAILRSVDDKARVVD